jgi:hypothetical protein
LRDTFELGLNGIFLELNGIDYWDFWDLKAAKNAKIPKKSQ